METINIPIEVLIDHIKIGGSPPIIFWMIDHATEWSISQRKAIHEAIKVAYRRKGVSAAQKYYLNQLRQALIQVPVQENSYYA